MDTDGSRYRFRCPANEQGPARNARPMQWWIAGMIFFIAILAASSIVQAKPRGIWGTARFPVASFTPRPTETSSAVPAMVSPTRLVPTLADTETNTAAAIEELRQSSATPQSTETRSAGSSSKLPTVTVTAQVRTITVMPLPTATHLPPTIHVVMPASCGGKTTEFAVGDTAISDSNGLRILRKYQGGAASTLAQANQGDRLQILQGPVCASSYQYHEEVWYWYVSFTKRGGTYEGWIAEGISGNSFICPLSNPDCY